MNNNNNNNKYNDKTIYKIVGEVHHSPPYPFPPGSPYFVSLAYGEPTAARVASVETHGGDKMALDLDLIKWREFDGAKTVWNGLRGWNSA